MQKLTDSQFIRLSSRHMTAQENVLSFPKIFTDFKPTRILNETILASLNLT